MLLKYVVKWQRGDNKQSIEMTPVDIVYDEKEFANNTYYKILDSLRWEKREEIIKDLTILGIYKI